jgi:hypothetical protein
MFFSPSMVKDPWLLPTFFLVNVAHVFNEQIEHDLILGGKPQWILQLFSICMNTKHESLIIYCVHFEYSLYYVWVGNMNVSKEANSYIEIN